MKIRKIRGSTLKREQNVCFFLEQNFLFYRLRNAFRLVAYNILESLGYDLSSVVDPNPNSKESEGFGRNRIEILQ
jgi:hypothetical protein